MKKLLLLLFILSLGLSACGAGQVSEQTSNAGSTSGMDPAARELSSTGMILVGIFRLEGTALEITPEQASQLLPLWQVFVSMSQSDTAAQAELDALVQQIQGAITQEQLQAIEAMQLTQQDMFTLMQEKGIQMEGLAGQEMSAEQIATVQALRSSGGGAGMPPDEAPGGGMPRDAGMPGGVMPSGTQTAGGQPRAGMGRLPDALLEALIELLAARAASA